MHQPVSRGWNLPEYTTPKLLKPGENVGVENDGHTCYAESRDGHHFTRPEVGLYEFAGSKKNNIVWAGNGSHNFAPFRDPTASGAGQYKAVGGNRKLFAWRSADGVKWELIRPEPVITDGA